MVGLADQHLAVDRCQRRAGDRALTGFIPAASEQYRIGLALQPSWPTKAIKAGRARSVFASCIRGPSLSRKDLYLYLKIMAE